MNIWILTIIHIGILTIVLGGLYRWRRKFDKNREFGKFSLAIFGLGMAGWTVALLVRLIPIQLLQLGVLSLLGADIQNPHTYIPFQTNFWVIIWGPLLAGIFEGGFRYICFKVYQKSKKDPKNSPFFLGLGWTTGEIIIIYIIPMIMVGIGGTLEISFGDSMFGLYERLIASAAHIIFSYFAFYALFEAKNKKISLLLSMGWHFLLDSMILVWIMFFSRLNETNPYTYAVSLYGALTLIVLLAFVFWKKIWYPRCQNTLQEYLEKQNEPKVFRDPTVKEDIEINSNWLD